MMDDIKKLQKYIAAEKYDKLIGLLDDHIDEVKRTLHDDNPEQLDFTKIYEYTMRCGKMATILSENAVVSNERYLFDGGYFTALVEELELFLDRLGRVQEWETTYRELSGKKHYVDIIGLLYSRDLVQNKVISDRVRIKSNQLSKIMKDMLDRRAVVVYEYSKYKYYGLAWEFKKYLRKIGFQKGNVVKTEDDYYVKGDLGSGLKKVPAQQYLTDMVLQQFISRTLENGDAYKSTINFKVTKDLLIKASKATFAPIKNHSDQYDIEESPIKTWDMCVRKNIKNPEFKLDVYDGNYLWEYGEKNFFDNSLERNGNLVGTF